MRQSKVAVVLPSLIGGGAERVAIDLANHWSEQSREVSLITIDRSDRSRYPVSNDVHRIGLDLMHESRSWWSAIRNNLLRVNNLRRALLETTASSVVSFTDITNVTTLLACRGTGLRTIVCERTDPRHHKIGRAWRQLRKRTYGKASAIVVQTASVRSWAESHGWKCPIVVVPNAAPRWTAAVPTTRAAELPRSIIALGRLSEEKGFHLLIEAFGRIASRYPEWQLSIFGEGNARAHLEQLVNELQLTNRVHLPGWVQDVEALLQSAQLFVLPSRYEGFPNALLEAMASGLACVSFDCDSGPREIIRHGIDGLLVPPGDVSELAEAIGELITNEPYRKRIAAEARHIVTRFSRDDFYRRWDAVLDDQ